MVEGFKNDSNPVDGAIECPRCHKHTVVEAREDYYVCLSCRFKRDVSKRAADDDFSPGLLAALIAGMLVFLLL